MWGHVPKMLTYRLVVVLIGAALMPFGAAAAQPVAAPSPECQIRNVDFSAKDIAGMSLDLLNRHANEAKLCAAYLTNELVELELEKLPASAKYHDHLKDQPFKVAEPATSEK